MEEEVIPMFGMRMSPVRPGVVKRRMYSARFTRVFVTDGFSSSTIEVVKVGHAISCAFLQFTSFLCKPQWNNNENEFYEVKKD